MNFGAGLGIISTINMLFVIGFVEIYCKQRPHEGPHIKSLLFCDGYHEKSVFMERGSVMCGVRLPQNFVLSPVVRYNCSRVI